MLNHEEAKAAKFLISFSALRPVNQALRCANNVVQTVAPGGITCYALGMRQPIYLFQALICGVVISFINSRNDAVQTVALLVAVTTFIFGMLHARRAWVYALIIGMSIILFHGVARMANAIVPMPQGSINNFAGLVALIPAFIGAYCGAGLRWVLDGFNEGEKAEG